MTTLPERALAFAGEAHASIDQRRKYVGTPYIEHPVAVAALVATAPGHTPEMLAAAYLHDVVEDTPVTLEQVRDAFGDAVADLVDELTDKATAADGNRAARKALECTRLGHVSPGAQTIKLADLIHNSLSIIEHDPKFARTYLAEKAALLDALTRGDDGLRRRARAVLEAGLSTLETAVP